MGTIYYAACRDCKKRIDLDKFYWGERACGAGTRETASSDGLEIRNAALSDMQENHAFRTYLLLAFIGSHNGHRLSFTSEHEDEIYEYEKQWPEVWG